MSDLIYSLQARVRQLLGTRGGPLVEGADFLQPVATIASAEGIYRNPALELGEGIHRQFVTKSICVNVVTEFCCVQLATQDPSSLLHVRRLIFNMYGTTSRIFVGRQQQSAITVGTSSGECALRDWRLPRAINHNGSALNLRQGTVAAASLLVGELIVQPAISSTLVLDVDFVLTAALDGVAPSTAPDALVIEAETSNTQFDVNIEGELYTFGPGAR